jgi:hypothetical protein
MSGAELSRATPGPLARWAPWLVLAVLVALCAVHGVRMTAGLVVSPDIDTARDIGYGQGFLNGNLFGDPTHPGERRFYPPLLPALRALLFRLSGGGDLAAFWMQTGAWLNLLVPLAFFGMARELSGSAAAAALATAVLVLWNGACERFWITGGYTPWPSGPILASALFFGVVWLIHERTGAGRWRDAALIGAGIGAVFLAHVVPAVVLTGIVTLAAFASQGLRARTLGWLALVALVQLVVMAPYFLPVLIAYPGGTVHSSYEWVDPAMLPVGRRMVVLALLNVPGLLAAVLALAFRRDMPFGRLTAAMLAAWIGVCGILLLRHYACAGFTKLGWERPSACGVFVVAVHHYHLYLQLGWACLIGLVGCGLARRWTLRPNGEPAGARPRIAVAFGAALLVLGGAAFLTRGFDADWRESALERADHWTMDMAIYRWALAETRPGAMFVTDVEDNWRSPAAYAVMAAGRGLVAAPVAFSHPYLDWMVREAERLHLIAAVTRSDAPLVPCNKAEAGLWFVLDNDTTVLPGRAERLFSTASRSVYRASLIACGTGAPASG